MDQGSMFCILPFHQSFSKSTLEFVSNIVVAQCKKNYNTDLQTTEIQL